MEKHTCVIAVKWGFEESSFTGEFLTAHIYKNLSEEELEDSMCKFDFCPFCGKKIDWNKIRNKESK